MKTRKILICIIALTVSLAAAVFAEPVHAEESDFILSSYATSFNPGVIGRTKNVRLAAEKIDGTILYPGEVFSFNETVGPATKRRGFKLAKVFFKGKEKEGYGGGICQVSSTLYNAALDAELTITERHPHSKRVYYVPKGMDAATSYGGVDLKFTNDFDYPVVIKADISKKTLTVSILQCLQTN